MSVRRLIVGPLVLLAVVASWARPAAAHNVSGVEPTDYDSRIVSVTPRVRGLRVRVIDLGTRLEVRNRTTTEVVVLREEGRAMRRIPPSTTARIEDEGMVYAGREPAGGTRVVGSWTVEMRHGDIPVTVTGVITYVPGPSPWPWIALIGALFAATIAAAWSRQWGKWLSVALALLLASDVIHSFGTAAATQSSLLGQIGRVLLAGLVTAAAWVVGVIAIPSLQRNNEGGLVAAAAVGLVIAVFSGVADIGVFANSQLPTAFPFDVARVAVALAFGLGVGLVVATIAVIARDPALRPTAIGHSGGTDP